MQDPNLIIQPAGHNTIQTWKNFERTILTPVPIETIRAHAGDELADSLQAIYPSGSVPTWGLEPHNEKKVWNRIHVGDAVLFVGDKKAFMSATVSYEPLHSRELALALWGVNQKNGQTTWEYIYFVDDLHDQNIPYEELSKLVGYGEKNNFMSATVRTYGESKAAFEVLGLESSTYLVQGTHDKSVPIELDDSFLTDRQSKGTSRAEQRLLRSILFKGKAHERCGICLKEYPVRFLVTAHIKKRKACSRDEKLDLYNIAMPMCVFGCDALYEQGYAGVDTQTKEVITIDDPNLPEVVRIYLSAIAGNTCVYVNDNSAAYFEYHNQQMVHAK